MILTGISANSCIMLTASDAYVRDLKIIIPADCCSGQSPEQQSNALQFIKDNFKAETMPANEIDLKKITSPAEE